MNIALLHEISNKDFDKAKFVELIKKDEELRDYLVKEMIFNENIMVYYHCYYIIEDASLFSPELFYKYWNEIKGLLSHSNSYHRNFALAILANLTKVDEKNLIFDAIEDYLRLLNDEKYMTASCCVINSGKIMLTKKELMDTIVERLLDLYSQTKYTDKQTALLMSDVIVTLNEVYHQYNSKSKLINFVEKNTTSISPKTKKLAKEFGTKV